MLEDIEDLMVVNLTLHKEDDTEQLTTLYGHVLTKQKDLCFSRHKQVFFPGSRLMWVVGCIPSKGKLPNIQDYTQPTVGDIVFDVKGNLWEIKSVEYA